MTNRNEYIASVLRGLGGQDPEMPNRTEEQNKLDKENSKDFCKRLKKSVEILEKDTNKTLE